MLSLLCISERSACELTSRTEPTAQNCKQNPLPGTVIPRHGTVNRTQFHPQFKTHAVEGSHLRTCLTRYSRDFSVCDCDIGPSGDVEEARLSFENARVPTLKMTKVSVTGADTRLHGKLEPIDEGSLSLRLSTEPTHLANHCAALITLSDIFHTVLLI